MPGPSMARPSCIFCERIVVREPSMNSDGWRLKEPGEECRLLNVVREAVRHEDGRRVGTGERVCNFKVVLASGYLPDVPPGWRWIIAEWVIYPLSDLVRQGCRIFSVPPPEESGGVE